MKISPEISIAEFDVPNIVHEVTLPAVPAPAVPAPAVPVPRTESSYIGPRDYKLSELSTDELATLCANFTAAVFKKAGKALPPKGGCQGL